MHDQGRGVRHQQLGHIRIQGVVGEEALHADGQQRDFDIEQSAVEAGDAVASTGGPPSPQPMAHGEPAERAHRSRHDVDIGELDGVRLGCILHGALGAEGRSHGDMPRLTDNTPQPVGAGQVGEGDLGCGVSAVVDRPGQHRAADFQHRD